jgi:hypothetical protein
MDEIESDTPAPNPLSQPPSPNPEIEAYQQYFLVNRFLKWGFK